MCAAFSQRVQLVAVRRPVFRAPGSQARQTVEIKRGLAKAGCTTWLLCLVSVLLFSGSAPLRAGEPMLMLAMVRYDQFQVHRVTFSPESSVIHNSRRALQLTPAPAHATATLQLATFKARPFFSVGAFQKAPAPHHRNPLLLSRTNLRNYGHPKTWASLEAGYGDVFDENPAPLSGHNGAGWEAPSYGFLKLSFTF